MKVRTDFVTNSSSVSFGVAAVQTIASVLTTSVAVAAVAAADAASRMVTDSVLTSAEEAAQVIAQTASREAEIIESATDQMLSAEDITLNDAEKGVRDEIKAYQDQWKAAQEGADPSDAGYAKLKEQYDSYFKYLDEKLADIGARRYELDVAKAQEAAAEESKNEWVRGRQQDLIAVTEERALLEAGKKGYGGAGYDVRAYDERLKQLAERERELHTQLREKNADISHTPRDRGVIGPGKEFDQIHRDYQRAQAEMAEARKLKDAEKRAEAESRLQERLAELEQAQRSAARWDMSTKAVEGVQFGADLAVDALSNVTGSAGKSIRLAYIGAKGVAGGIGQSMADGGNYASNIGKGLLKGASDVIKDKLGDKDKYGKYAKGAFTLVSESGQAAIDAYTKGESVMKGAVTGLAKGAVEVGVDGVVDKFLPSPDPLQVNWGGKSLGYTISGIRSRNPLTMAIGKSTLGAAAKGGAVDQGKNLLKGDDMIFSGWSTSYSAGGLADRIMGK